MTLDFILVSAGAVRPAVVCSGHYIVLHRDARRGGLQAWWERGPGLQVPEVLIEASVNIVAKAEGVCDRYPSSRVPRSWGITLPFIGQGEGDLQVRRTIFLCVEAWRAVPQS
jgi:hypothetical protein